MWDMFLERAMPTSLEMLCIALAFLIPFGIYKINQSLHKDMDPPWKQEEEQQ